MNNLIEKVIQWAEDRGIIANSTAEKQMLKTIEEVGELAKAIAKNDMPGIIDGIGDVMVTLIIQSHKQRLYFSDVLDEEKTGKWVTPENKIHTCLLLSCSIGGLCCGVHRVGESHEMLDRLASCTHWLIRMSEFYNISLEHCLESAYNEISKRKGKMENGLFVKEEVK